MTEQPFTEETTPGTSKITEQREIELEGSSGSFHPVAPVAGPELCQGKMVVGDRSGYPSRLPAMDLGRIHKVLSTGCMSCGSVESTISIPLNIYVFLEGRKTEICRKVDLSSACSLHTCL